MILAIAVMLKLSSINPLPSREHSRYISSVASTNQYKTSTSSSWRLFAAKILSKNTGTSRMGVLPLKKSNLLSQTYSP